MSGLGLNGKFERLLPAVERLSQEELNLFTDRVLKIRARKIAPSLSGKETEFLEKIYNRGPSLEQRNRLDQLIAYRETETLTSQDHQELLTLIEIQEAWQADRLQNLMAVAELRGISLDELMDQLGIERTHS